MRLSLFKKEIVSKVNQAKFFYYFGGRNSWHTTYRFFRLSKEFVKRRSAVRKFPVESGKCTFCWSVSQQLIGPYPFFRYVYFLFSVQNLSKCSFTENVAVSASQMHCPSTDGTLSNVNRNHDPRNPGKVTALLRVKNRSRFHVTTSCCVKTRCSERTSPFTFVF